MGYSQIGITDHSYNAFNDSPTEPIAEYVKQKNLSVITLATIQHIRAEIFNLPKDIQSNLLIQSAQLTTLNGELFWKSKDDISSEDLDNFYSLVRNIREQLAPNQDLRASCRYGNGQLISNLEYRFSDNAFNPTNVGEFFGNHPFLTGIDLEKISTEFNCGSITIMGLAGSGLVEAGIIRAKLGSETNFDIEIRPVYFQKNTGEIVQDIARGSKQTFILPFDDSVVGKGTSIKALKEACFAYFLNTPNSLLISNHCFEVEDWTKYRKHIEASVISKQIVNAGDLNSRKFILRSSKGETSFLKSGLALSRLIVEVTSNLFYRQCGFHVPEITALNSTGIFMRLIDGETNIDKISNSDFIDEFNDSILLAIFLNDYDRLPRNCLVTEEEGVEKLYQLDFGGTLFHRASGGFNGFAEEITDEEIKNILSNPRDIDVQDHPYFSKIILFDEKGQVIIENPEAISFALKRLDLIDSTFIQAVSEYIAKELFVHLDIDKIIDKLEIDMTGNLSKTDKVRTESALQFFKNYKDTYTKIWDKESRYFKVNPKTIHTEVWQNLLTNRLISLKEFFKQKIVE